MSMGIIESGEYNKVAGLVDGSDGTVIESHALVADKLTEGVAVKVAQITVPKGKWMIFGQLHTMPFTNANNLLSLIISSSKPTGSSLPAKATVDQRRQVVGIWGFVQGMLFVNPTSDSETIKLWGMSSLTDVDIIKAEIVAVKVSD